MRLIAAPSQARNASALASSHSKKTRSRISADLHRLGDAGDLVARLQRAQEVEVVEDGERRRETAEQVLDAECVDAVLHADARVVLRQHRRRHADVADAAMRRRGDVADQVEEGAAADADDEVVPIDAQVDQPLLQSREQRRVVLDVLAARHDLGMRDELEALAVQARVARDVVPERGKRRSDVGVDEDDEAMAPCRLAPQQRVAEHRVVVREEMLGEAHRVLVGHRERLQIDGRTLVVATLRQKGDLGTHGRGSDDRDEHGLT